MDNIKDILQFAIKREQEAHDFYVRLAGKTSFEGLKSVLTQFAQEELGHKQKLEKIEAGAESVPQLTEITDLKIADYTVSMQASDNMTYQDTLILAMNREKAAYRLYNDLASRTADANVKNLFLALAQEEAKHKLRFETEYDQYILTEN
jgi:rubrerythrin